MNAIESELDRPSVSTANFWVLFSVALLALSLLLLRRTSTLVTAARTDDTIDLAFPSLEVSCGDPFGLKSSGRRGRGSGSDDGSGCLLRLLSRLKSLINSVSCSTKDGSDNEVGHDHLVVEDVGRGFNNFDNSVVHRESIFQVLVRKIDPNAKSVLLRLQFGVESIRNRDIHMRNKWEGVRLHCCIADNFASYRVDIGAGDTPHSKVLSRPVFNENRERGLLAICHNAKGVLLLERARHNDLRG